MIATSTDPSVAQAVKASEMNQWDAGMRASMQVCLVDHWDILEFIWGYEINKKANEADQIIIKKDDDAKIDDVVAEFFARLNVIEFKSPGDHLGVPEFYTVLAYASLIVAYGFKDAPVDPSEVTITLVREARPDKVISYLRSKGLEYSKPHPGVYRFIGDHFPIQIIAYGEMEDDRWLVMRSMTREMTAEMRTAVRSALAPFLTPGVKQELLDAIVHTYFKANKKLFEEGDPMFEWLEPVYKPKMDRIAAESMALGRSEGIVMGRSEGIAMGRSEGIALGEARGLQQGMLRTLFGLVHGGHLKADIASAQAGLSLDAFNAKMAEYEEQARDDI